jgi:hypothetical protein
MHNSDVVAAGASDEHQLNCAALLQARGEVYCLHACCSGRTALMHACNCGIVLPSHIFFIVTCWHQHQQQEEQYC